nr:PGF-pre-PGF domain-containing protein [uncultured Methanolobus sp.]
MSTTSDDWGSYFKLTSDITLVGNHTPIGNSSIKFTGDFDGDGYTISNLTIYETTSFAGFFGRTNTGANIHDLGIETSSDGVDSTDSYVAGLVAELCGTVSNCSFSGTVTGGTGSYVGGLIGDINGGNISDCFATGTVSSDANYAGGLAGDLYMGYADNCYANVTVTSSYDGGYASVGGLFGENYGYVSNCYATGDVSCTGTGIAVGGLFGSNAGTVSNCYATGNVSGNDMVGGLIGYTNGWLTGNVINSFATGTASTTASGSDIGGLVGYNNGGTVTNSYYSGTPASGEGTQSSYANFTSFAFVSGASGLNWNASSDIISTDYNLSFVWKIDEGSTLPYFQYQITYVGSGSDCDYTTIQAAVNAAYEGDTIVVTDGTYNENVDVDKSVTIRSQNGAESTIIQALSASDNVFSVTANNVTINGFTVTGATDMPYAGINLEGNSNCTIINNIASNNKYGIYLYISENNTLTNNTASSNDNDGIFMRLSSNNTLINNICRNNWDGINLLDSENNTLTNNTGNDSHNGICISSSTYNTLTGNVVGNDTYGIYMYNSTYNTLTGNVAEDNDHYSIYMQESTYNTLTGNVADDANNGIYMSYSTYNTLTNNTASNNSYGIYLGYSSSNNLTGNIMSLNTYNLEVRGASLGDYYNDLDTTNLVSGSPVYYLTNSSNETIPANAGTVYLINCTNMSVRDITFTNESYGIYLYETDNSTIENITTSGCKYDIYFKSSPDCEIDMLKLLDDSAILSFVTDSVETEIRSTECDLTLSGKEAMTDGYIYIDRTGTFNVTFAYNDTGISSSVESSVNLYYFNFGTGTWEEVANTILDTTSNTVSVNLPESGQFFALFRDPNSEATTTSSSSGTRASVSQGQDPAIVGASASAVKRITGDSEVDYDFSDSGTPVLGISFDATKDKGLVVAKVQVLSSNPDGVPSPSGRSYQMLSIDVGSEGTISSDSAENIMIRFKVSKQWIEENNIDISTIRMTRYHGEQWNDLPTYQEREEDGYIYFYAETPGFSIFEVVGDEKSAISEQVPVSTPVTEEFEEPVAEEETSSTPGFTAIAGIVFVSLAVLLRRK